MSINISDFVLESAHQDITQKRERTAEYYAKMHLQEGWLSSKSRLLIGDSR